MSYPVHYVPAGDVLPVFFSTYGKTNGESLTMTGLAVTDIEIYKDGGVTQRASDAGYTLLDTDGIDFDAITGIHGFSIDTGDNTDAGFYTVGAWFHVVVSAVTVDAQTVNFIACAFRLMPAESVAGKPKVDVDAWLGTAAATPTVAGVPEVDVTHWLGTAAATPTVAGVPEVDATHFGGTAGTFASGRPEVNATHFGGAAVTATTSVTIPASSTLATTTGAVGSVTGAVGSVTGAVGSVTGNVGGNVTGSIGSLAAQAKADVNAEADTALSDYDPPTYTELLNLVRLALRKDVALATDLSALLTSLNADLGSGAGAFANTTDALEAVRDRGDAAWITATGFSTLDAAGVRTAVGLASANLDTQLAALPTAAENADAVWEEAIADHSGTAGSTAESLNAAGSAGDPWTTTLPGSYTGSQAGKMLSDILTDTGTTLQGELDGIQADTEDIQTRLPAALVGGRMDASVGAMAADVLTASALAADAVSEIQSGLSTLDAAGVRTAVGLAAANLDTQLDALPTAAENADAIWDEATIGHTTAGTFGEQLKTDVDAILVDTAEIGAAGAGLTEAGGTGDHLTAVPWNASWDAEVESEVADALEATIADSVPADGSRPSVKQALYLLTQFMLERSVSGTTVTVKKPDGSTSLFTLTLDDATSPTSITRAT